MTVKKNMIVAAQPEAAEVGARVLMQGGNAVDAAIAAALVQGVVDPQMTGIAGFGNAQVFMPGQGIHTCLDFHGKTPLAATPDMWLDQLEAETRDGFGFVLKNNANDLGYQAVTTPGSLMAYGQMIERFGNFDWKDICAPAIDIARKGFLIRPAVQFWWMSGATLGRVQVDERLGFSASGRQMYFRPDGTLKRVGDLFQNPDLGNTLERIAKHGYQDFYQGEIAEQIDADMAKHGGLLSKQDLSEYQTTQTDPLRGNYRGLEVATNQPPGGGIMLLEMLNILENFPLAELGHNSTEYIRIVCEAMRAATADKEMYVGDPNFVDVPIDKLISKNHAADIATRIQQGERMRVERFTPESKDTTHVAIMDADGNCVTMTHSLGMPSGVITDGLGFMYNGCMGVFDPRPERTGSIAPGKSRFSSLCPTMVFNGEQPQIVLGAPGGTQIAMGVLHALLNMIDHKMPVLDAVSAPRFSATSNAIDISNRIPSYAVEPLVQAGYEIIRSPLSFGFAAVHAITNDASGLNGAADPGQDGVALSV